MIRRFINSLCVYLLKVKGYSIIDKYDYYMLKRRGLDVYIRLVF